MEPVLSYGDSKLLERDVRLLEGPFWLNDQVIGFAFEWLAREAFPQPGLLLVGGSSTFLLGSLGADGAAVVLHPLGFACARLVLFALNDNPDVQHAEGGSHWSLLAYNAADATFRHYDSLAGANAAVAARVAAAAAAAVPQRARLREQPTPQQRNGHDCGAYVVALARLLCARHARHGDRMGFDVAPGELPPASVGALRGELLQLIRGKAAAQGAGGGGGEPRGD